jgi:hypothetical protein
VTAVKNASAISNQYYNFLTDFVDSARTAIATKYDTEYGESNIADDLNKLALGADEFKRLGQFLRLNQEIKTKSSELIDFVQKIESCITERVSLMKKVKQRLGEKYEADDVENFDFLEFAKSFISDPDNPEAYHNKQIELYEQYCKTCINPLRVLTSVDHYKGYLEALIMAYNGDFMKSVKFRAIKTIGNSFINNFKISSK